MRNSKSNVLVGVSTGALGGGVLTNLILIILVLLIGPASAHAAVAPGPFGNRSNLLTMPSARTELTTGSAKSELASPPSLVASKTGAPTNAPSNTSTAAKSLTFSCADLRRTALNMSVHASNMANRNTSRTPEGGPYKRQDVVCKAAGGAFCDIQKIDASVTKYEPGHPDADPNGYVKLPDINLGTESAGMIGAANELKIMAAQGACGTKALEQGPITVVKYHEDFEVMMDTMNFAPDGRIIRWSRTTRDGKTQNLSFKDDGTPVGL